MWRKPDVNDRYYRDDITCVFVGRHWFYAWVEERRELHRLAWFDDTHDVAITQSFPRTSQHLTQIFHNKKNSDRYRSWRPRYRPTGWRAGKRYQGSVRPDVSIALVNPYTLALPTLTAIYDRISPSPMPHAFTMLQTALRRTVPLVESQGYGIVTHVPDGVSAITITPYLHLVRMASLPDSVRLSSRAPRISRDARITVTVPYNPKRPGSGAMRRFSRYETGITVQEFLDRGGTMDDVANDEAHGYISMG